MYTVIHKSKYHWVEVSWTFKNKVKEYNISIVYTMVAYKLKVINSEDDTLNFSPMRQNINDYPREDNNCGDESIIVLQYDGHLCDTIIVDNTDIMINKFP